LRAQSLGLEERTDEMEGRKGKKEGERERRKVGRKAGRQKER
jgi:hypothetical protein